MASSAFLWVRFPVFFAKFIRKSPAERVAQPTARVRPRPAAMCGARSSFEELSPHMTVPPGRECPELLEFLSGTALARRQERSPWRTLAMLRRQSGQEVR